MGRCSRIGGTAVVTDLGAETTVAHDRVGCLETIAFYAHHGFIEYLKVLRAPNPVA